jgi:hypothetical protein
MALATPGKLYSLKPHPFRRLGKRAITCADCGNLSKHTLHAQWEEIQRNRPPKEVREAQAFERAAKEAEERDP